MIIASSRIHSIIKYVCVYAIFLSSSSYRHVVCGMCVCIYTHTHTRYFNLYWTRSEQSPLCITH